MKSLTAVCQTGASMPAINPNGRAIGRHQHPHRENAEMKMYLSKLKDLVPFMPKNRKLSKLEIIQHVIDYICDLQSELETHPEMGNFDAASALNFAASQNMPIDDEDALDEDETQEQAPLDGDDDEDALVLRLAAESRQLHHLQQQQQQQHPHHHRQQQQQSSPARQPLVDRQAPNTILPASAVSSSSAAAAVAVAVQQPPVQQAVAPSAQTTSGDKDSRQASC